MVGWKTIFRRSRSRGPLDQHIPKLDDFDDSLIRPCPIDNKDDEDKTDGNRENRTTRAAKVAPRDELLPADIRDYYYPDMDKDSANEALKFKPVGTFLLRKSKSPEAKYTLSVRSERHIFNIRIFYRLQDENGYHLDAPKHLRKYFPSISTLLYYYSQAPRELIALCVADEEDEAKTTFKLKYPLSRSDNALNLGAADDTDPDPNPNHNQLPILPPRLVARQPNGGSMKAMVKWL